ncbi:hypothetical protein G6514_000984 [Epicoccum nigrum]|nr:hypothetical protein G6514_000984 [Epicoccum nigrum]
MPPVSGRLRFQRILRAMRARTSRFHQVRKLVISGYMLRKALEVVEYNLLNGKDHVETTRNDFPNLKVIVWPNGEDETKSKDEREAAMRYCFDKPDLQLVDVEYDIYYKNGAIFEHFVDRDFDDDDNNNNDDDMNDDDEQAENGNESDYQPSEDDEEVSQRTGSIEDVLIDDKDIPEFERHDLLRGWQRDDEPLYYFSTYERYSFVQEARSLRLVARSSTDYKSSDG